MKYSCLFANVTRYLPFQVLNTGNTLQITAAFSLSTALKAVAPWILCGSALAQVTMISGGGGSGTLHISKSPQGVQILAGRGGDDVQTQTTDAPTPHSKQAIDKAPPRLPTTSVKTDGLVSPQLVVAPGGNGITRPVRPAQPGSAVQEDERVKILMQEMERETKELNAKQRLLQLPAGKDPLVDEMRDRVKAEVKTHMESIVGLQREIKRLTKSARGHTIGLWLSPAHTDVSNLA